MTAENRGRSAAALITGLLVIPACWASADAQQAEGSQSPVCIALSCVAERSAAAWGLSRQTEGAESRSFGDDVSVTWQRFKYTFTAPTRWSGSDLKVLGTWTTLVIGAVLVEEEVRDFIQDNRADFGDVLERVGFYYGSPIVTVPTSLLVYTAGVLFDSNGLRDTGMMLSDVILTVALVQQPLRIAVGRARPLVGAGNLSFNPFSIADEYASFISGHVWSALGFSIILTRQIRTVWASIGLYTLAATTAWSRLYKDKHWLSDVVMGGALGYYSARTLWHWDDYRSGAGARFTLVPVANGFVARLQF